MANSYSKNVIKNGRFYKIEVRETRVLDLPLQSVEGIATLTHIGGGKRLRFLLDGVEFISESGNEVAISTNPDNAILMENISFDKDIAFYWDKYIRYSKTFWMSTEE